MILQLNLDMDFSATTLNEALKLFKQNDCEDTGFRLILSYGYVHREILEVIFNCRGVLDIPFEISYALPCDGWILVNGAGDLFYSKGA